MFHKTHVVRRFGLLLLLLGIAALIGAIGRASGTAIVLAFTLTLVGLMLALDKAPGGRK